jgi:hypothetical protein
MRSLRLQWIALLCAISILVRCSPAVGQATDACGGSIMLERRHATFARATAAGDVARVREFFPDASDVTYVNTLHSERGDVNTAWRFPATEIDAALRYRGPLWYVFATGGIEFVSPGSMNETAAKPGQRWRRSGRTRYVARTSRFVYVQWRCEGHLWVIGAFGDESWP